MYKRILHALLLAATMTGTGSFAGGEPSGTDRRVRHVVIIWLKEAGNSAAREQYISRSRQMSKLPMVLDYRVGTVLPGHREVVDDSYDLAVLATFANQQALAEYLEHPEHKRIVEDSLKPLVARAVVYDFAEAP